MRRRSNQSVGLSASLTALVSPLSLAAIAVLLINDHLLKQLSPSLLTGKLSDFTGLYFAPYVVLAAIFAMPLGALRRRPFEVARVSYLAIAAVFVALKLTESTAAPLLAVASGLGFPVAIAADPTDLAALCMLPLSYAAWAIRVRGPVIRPRRLLRAGVLALAALSMLATSGPPQPSIRSIAIDSSGDLYAAVEYTKSSDGVYVLHLGDRTWDRLTTTGQQLVADPRRGTVYALDSGGSAPTVDRLTRDGAEHIGPPPAARSREYYGPTFLVAAPWVEPVLFLARNGDLLATRDSGKTWVDRLNPAEMRALAVSTEEGLLYIVTASDLTPGVAWLYRSRDAGSHWTYMESLPIGSFSDATVAVHPTVGQLVFLGSTTELRRSTDGGISFTTIIAKKGTNWTWDLRFDPTDDDHLLLIQGFGCCPLLESRDRGLTWSEAGIDATEIAIGADGSVYAVSAYRDKVLRRVGDEWVDVTYSLPVQRSR
jgi:hypothetical protein